MFLGNSVQTGWLELKQGQQALWPSGMILLDISGDQGLILGKGKEGRGKEEA